MMIAPPDIAVVRRAGAVIDEPSRTGCAGDAVSTAPVSALALPVSFAVISTRSAFDRLEPEWNALFERAAHGAHMFQQFNWLWHWANHYLDRAGGDDGRRSTGPRLAIVTGRINGRLVLVWPLVVTDTRCLRQVSWMGEPAGQYGDVLLDARAIQIDADRKGCDAHAATEHILGASWRFLIAAVQPDVVHLRKVRADAVVGPFLDALGASTSAGAEAPYLDLPPAQDFVAYEARYSAKARKNRRRLLRRLSERACIEIESHRDNAAARELATLAVSLKRAWLHDRRQLSRALYDDRFARFLADACGGGPRATGARVSVLRSGGEPASIEVGFEAKGTLNLHLIVYSLKFEKTGAGVLHLEDGIRRACADGVRTLDLLAPRADYKMDWADGVVAVADRSIPFTPQGYFHVHVYLGFARGRAKTLAERMWLAMRRRPG